MIWIHEVGLLLALVISMNDNEAMNYRYLTYLYICALPRFVFTDNRATPSPAQSPMICMLGKFEQGLGPRSDFPEA